MPSIKQKIAAQKLSEIIRNPKGIKSTSMGKILREAGYSRHTSLKPKLVTEAKGFKEELEKIIPNNSLVQVHSQLIDAMILRRYCFAKGLSKKEILDLVEGIDGCRVKEVIKLKNGSSICYYWAPDYISRFKALELIFKLKGYPQSIANKGRSSVVKVEITNYH